MLSEEYVDIYGVPFSIIPFRGRQAGEPLAEPDQPKNHVQAIDSRKLFEIKFPMVEGYAFALKHNLIKADLSTVPTMTLDAGYVPNAVFVKPQVGYQLGQPRAGGGFQFEAQDRQAYYASTHLQTIKFEIARLVVIALTEGIEGIR